jgi:hypothetical protein
MGLEARREKYSREHDYHLYLYYTKNNLRNPKYNEKILEKEALLLSIMKQKKKQINNEKSLF